jgi:hypothetical protein
VLVALALSGGACASDARAPDHANLTATVKTCRANQDADCPGGFCDRGVCQVPTGVYGRVCTPAPRTREGPRDGKLHACGAYLCIDGRCRSCQSDAECRSELGAPRCYKAPGEPGSRCGNPSP